MTKRDVKVGATYRIKLRGEYVDALILEVLERDSGGNAFDFQVPRKMTHWRAKNLKTGREIEIKSAAKLLREVTPPSPV